MRALHGLGHAALLLAVFEGCSGNDTNPPPPPARPATISIAGIYLGTGSVGDGGASSVLACDYAIGVNVTTTDWTLRGPGRCGGALQCGQLRVSLLDGPDGSALLPPLVAANNGVALDVSSLLPSTVPSPSRGYAIKVELVDDAGVAYVPLEGGNGSAQQAFNMSFPACPAPGTAGSGGTSGASGGGAGRDSAAGDDNADAAGTAGSVETAGNGGNAETAGNGGTGGNAETAGSSGTAGGGTAGTVETSGTAGL